MTLLTVSTNIKIPRTQNLRARGILIFVDTVSITNDALSGYEHSFGLLPLPLSDVNKRIPMLQSQVADSVGEDTASLASAVPEDKAIATQESVEWSVLVPSMMLIRFVVRYIYEMKRCRSCSSPTDQRHEEVVLIEFPFYIFCPSYHSFAARMEGQLLGLDWQALKSGVGLLSPLVPSAGARTVPELCVSHSDSSLPEESLLLQATDADP